MKKIFFSQRFHGKTESEIFDERYILREYLKNLIGEEIEIIDQYHLEAPKDAPYTWNWSQDLLLLGKADLVVFCKDWEEALGCQVEMLACKKYVIPYMIVPI